MPRLVVQPGTPQAWEIYLKPGINFLGRGASNDFKFDDLSISGAHCQIIVDGALVTIRDTGSTNGTFVNRAKIQESRLSTGQPVRLGSLDMMFYADAPQAPVVATPPPATAPPPVPVVSAPPVSIPVPPPMPAVRVAEAIPAAAPASAGAPIAAVLKISSAPVSIPSLPPPPATRAPESAPVPAPAPALRISGLHAAAPAPASAPEAPEMEPPLAGTSAPPAIAIDVGARFCKFHPKSAARYLCKKCNRAFCEFCVTTLTVGNKTKINCRHCAVECVPLQVHHAETGAPKNFFGSLPGAFAYPVRGSGFFVLLVGMVIFAGIRLGSMMMMTLSPRNIGIGVIIQIVLGGYLFTLLQNIIHSTASGENEMPELAGINFLEDILLPFCRLLGLILVCFVPSIALGVIALATASPAAAIGIFPAMLFGCAYFPMAFLAVAILDTVGAVNPLVIIPSILKVPLEYILTVIILAGVLVITKLGDIVLALEFPKGLMTDSIPELLAMIGLKFFWGLVGVYLLMVNTRILGMLYLSKKGKLNWLSR